MGDTPAELMQQMVQKLGLPLSKRHIFLCADASNPKCCDPQRSVRAWDFLKARLRELGLSEAEVPFEALRDPYGIAFWPNFTGRDGCRTPMPWNGGDHAGFTDGHPWLPIPAEHRAISVAKQDADPSSVLNTVRRFLAWRKTQPALQVGAIRFLDAPEPVLAFRRDAEGHAVLAVFNLSAQPVDWQVPGGLALQAIEGHGLAAATLVGERLSLPPRGVYYARIV